MTKRDDQARQRRLDALAKSESNNWPCDLSWTSSRGLLIEQP
jgi:hypothetical protein